MKKAFVIPVVLFVLFAFSETKTAYAFEMCEGPCAQCNYTKCGSGESCYAKGLFNAAICKSRAGYQMCRNSSGKCQDSGVGGSLCDACKDHECGSGSFCVTTKTVHGQYKARCVYRSMKGPVNMDRARVCDPAGWCAACIGKKCSSGQTCYVNYNDLRPACKAKVTQHYTKCKNKTGSCAKCPDCDGRQKCYKEKGTKQVFCMTDFHLRYKKCSKSEMKKALKSAYKKAKSEKSKAWSAYKSKKKEAKAKYEEVRKLAWDTYKVIKKDAFNKYKQTKEGAKKLI